MASNKNIEEQESLIQKSSHSICSSSSDGSYEEADMTNDPEHNNTKQSPIARFKTWLSEPNPAKLAREKWKGEWRKYMRFISTVREELILDKNRVKHTQQNIAQWIRYRDAKDPIAEPKELSAKINAGEIHDVQEKIQNGHYQKRIDLAETMLVDLQGLKYDTNVVTRKKKYSKDELRKQLTELTYLLNDLYLAAARASSLYKVTYEIAD